MAKIGLNNFRYAILTETGTTASYDGARSLGKAIDCKVAIENYTAELYADDVLAESDYTFKKGTVTLTIDEDDDTVFAELLGHSVDEETGEIIKDSELKISLVLIDDKGKSYATGSKTFAFKMQKLLGEYGGVEDLEKGIDIKIIKVPAGKGGNKALSFELL